MIMKNNSIVFDYLPSKEKILENYSSSNDPRSWSYIRKYKIPKINYFRSFMHCFVPTFLAICLFYILKKEFQIELAVYISTFILILYIFLKLKLIVKFFIELYQSLAPISVREKCRFEPSCSEYMLLCVEKYGVIKGVKKGLFRLKRCRNGDGGYDNP